MSNSQNSSTNSKDDGSAQKIRLNIKVDDSTARGIYSNTAFIHHTENEFILDFVFTEPGRPQAHVVSRIITNPKAAKQLALGLKSLVDRYEERFGTINMPQSSKAAPPQTYN